MDGVALAELELLVAVARERGVDRLVGVVALEGHVDDRTGEADVIDSGGIGGAVFGGVAEDFDVVRADEGDLGRGS